MTTSQGEESQTQTTTPQGGTATTPARGTTVNVEVEGNPNRQDIDAQVSRSLQRLIDRSGGLDSAATLLFTENREYRQRIRELEGQVPAQGSVTLDTDQAAQWAAFQALMQNPASTPDALPESLRTRLTQGSEALEREQTRELARVGNANPTVLADRLRNTGLEAAVVDVPAVNGQAARQEVHVFQRNADGTRGTDQGELRAYAGQHWQDYVSVLFPAQATPQGGTVITGQVGAGNAGTGASSYAARILAERQAAANPNPQTGGNA